MLGLPVIYYGDELGLGQRSSLPTAPTSLIAGSANRCPGTTPTGTGSCSSVSLGVVTGDQGLAVTDLLAPSTTRDSGSAGSDDGSREVAGRMSPFFDSP
jgi:hypothetical protein